MPLNPVPKPGQGPLDEQSAAAVTQLQNLRLLPQQLTAALTASSARATLALSDAQSVTLSVSARLAGAHGARTVVQARRQTDPTLFDLEVWFPDDAAVAVGASSVDTTNDAITFASAPGWNTGAGPLFFYGTLPAGLSASSPYWAIRSTSVTYRLATTRANALSSVSVDLTSAGGAHSARLGREERFVDLSMRPAHKRYAVAVVNQGRDGRRASEYVRLTQVSSNSVDPRPVNVGPVALAGGGTGEVAFAGIKRRDHVLAALNLTTGAVWQSSAVVAVDEGRMTFLAGNASSGDRVVAFVLPG